ncbi:MAG: 4-(cytidine 5'-diphospho)-2-C-methyl-D-erythritol kinase [Acidobacteria bacterium]|nr:4-(cytidine 5'-diphospho)-2-C-methyl-D-erythritol kinase [Acidobacteriota bacterium]
MAVTVPSFAKLNLGLKVLGKRADGFHELRTVFQSISLADRLTIDYSRGRGTHVELASSIDIPDNLVTRAAHALMDTAGIRGTVRCKLEKHIPMGAGLGGGSSNAAAVLLALPALARKPVPPGELNAIAASLGSDVPYFLYGGVALGLGRGEELYPLPEPKPPAAVLLVLPSIHVSTPAAFATLARPALTELTPIGLANKIERLQLMAWGSVCAGAAPGWEVFCENDFEAAVFEQAPRLRTLHRQLVRLGARPARMSGSGSALYGLFASLDETGRAAQALTDQRNSKETVHTVRFINRARYRAAWRRALGVHVTEVAAWPPK